MKYFIPALLALVLFTYVSSCQERKKLEDKHRQQMAESAKVIATLLKKLAHAQIEVAVAKSLLEDKKEATEVPHIRAYEIGRSPVTGPLEDYDKLTNRE